MPSLCMALQDKRCALESLNLARNEFTEKAETWFRDYIMNYERCKARGLEISFENYTGLNL